MANKIQYCSLDKIVMFLGIDLYNFKVSETTGGIRKIPPYI